MIYLRHTSLIVISGLIWFAIGSFLMMMGLNFLMNSLVIENQTSQPLLDWMLPYFGSLETAVLALIFLALSVGYFKGKFVLGKSAKKGIERLGRFPNPTALSNIYSAKYYILLAIMIGLGISFKYLGISTDVRGLVDIAVGSALVNGSMFYFRACFVKNKNICSEKPV